MYLPQRLRSNGSLKFKTFICQQQQSVELRKRENEGDNMAGQRANNTPPQLKYLAKCKLRLYGAHWLGSHSGSVTTTFCNGPFGSKFLIDKAADAKKSLAKVYTIVSVSGWGVCSTGFSVSSWISAAEVTFILLLWQIHFAIRKNIYRNWDKYTLQLDEVQKGVLSVSLRKWHFASMTNTLRNLDKYILQSGQIHFAIWTNPSLNRFGCYQLE